MMSRIDSPGSSSAHSDPSEGVSGPSPLWRPNSQRKPEAALTAFTERCLPGSGHREPGAAPPGPLDGYSQLHRWSVQQVDRFWAAVWEFCGVIGDPGAVPSGPDGSDGAGPKGLRDHRWFSQAKLNFAENALHFAGLPGNAEAIVEAVEGGHVRRFTLDELRSRVAAIRSGLIADGVRSGDRVVAWMPNTADTVAIMLATLSLGAVFSSTSPDFGSEGVVDRFGQLDPVVMFATDRYEYNGRSHDCVERLAEIVGRLPTLRRAVLVPYPSPAGSASDAEPTPGSGALSTLDVWLEPHLGAELGFDRQNFDHPGFVLFSSGTTGKPKCIEHRAAGLLLTHLKEHRLHCDIRAGDRVFWFTTCGWMMWNWLTSALSCGATLVLYDGAPMHPGPQRLWQLAQLEEVSHFGVSAKYLDAVAGSGYQPGSEHELGPMRMIGSTGSPLSPERFEWIYRSVAADVHLASISGGTDLCGCFMAGVPTRPVFAGEIQGPALGMDVRSVDDQGNSVIDAPGELVCATPFPSMPLRFVGDDGTKFDAAYFDRFPGYWHHGDFIVHTERDGFVVLGRSDTTLNPGGVRIGTAEIYRQVDGIDGVEESLVFGQPWEGDVRIVLLVRLDADRQLDDALRDEIRRRVRSGCTPRHVPAVIAQVDDLPRTRSNKLVELAVADVAAGRTVRNTEAIANPQVLEAIRRLPELGQ